MDICNENITRKIDSLGRVSIPSGLRSRYNFNSGDELHFCTLTTQYHDYVMMYKDDNIDPKYVLAAQTLEELGCEIPEQLNMVLNN
jgi:bifunctional DNA-binding transcriptional regulator/antitoxin component of YhaV-PrlF toxin-antitoxin module